MTSLKSAIRNGKAYKRLMTRRAAIPVILVTLALILAAIFVPVAGSEDGLPGSSIEITDAAWSYVAPNGTIFAADSGYQRLLCFDRLGNVLFTVKLSVSSRILDVACDEYGGFFIHVMETDPASYISKSEVIKQYDKTGKFIKDAYILDYSKTDTPSHRYFRIRGIRLQGDGSVRFAMLAPDTVSVLDLDPDTGSVSTVSRKESPDAWFRYNDVRFLTDGSYVYTTRDGEIGRGISEGQTETPLAQCSFDIDEGGILPVAVAASGREVYFCDVNGKRVMRISESGEMSELISAARFSELGFDLSELSVSSISARDGIITGTVNGRVWTLAVDSGVTTFGGSMKSPASYVWSSVLKVTLIVLAVLMSLFCVYFIFDVLFERKISLFLKQTSVIVPAFAVVFLMMVGYMNDSMSARFTDEINQRIMTYTVTASRLFDGDAIAGMIDTDCVYSEQFAGMRKLQNEVLGHNADEWNRMFYNAIYVCRGNTMYLLSISNDSSANLSYYSDFDETWYEWATFHDGTAFSDVYTDATGDWIYGQAPIYTSDGKIAAVLETGADLTNFRASTGELTRGMIFRILMFCPIIVLCLCFITFVTLRCLGRTGKAVERIAAGNFDVRIERIPRDELGDICNGINTMAQNLSRSFSQTSKLRDVYFRFVPIQFMQLLGKKSITEIGLGDGVSMDMSILFFDIRSFSISSEMMTASENFRFVNQVTQIAGPIIRANNGFIDKYIGDAVMALFTDAQSAVDAGIKLYRSLVLDDQTNVKVGDDHINIGIGVHSGMTMIGIIGEEERLSSTVISNTVNLSSRLESLTKQYKAGMIISKDTLDRMSAPEKINMRFLGMIQVAGVNEVKALFEVLDCLDDETRALRLSTKADFENGVRKFHLGAFEASLECFKRIRKADPGDVSVNRYIDFIEEKQRNNDHDSKVFRFDKK